MINIPESYSLVQKYDLGEINSKGYLLRHKRSGAKVALVENDDKNKVFFIGFRTPPEDSTGVAHILEHSVLCGSKKYPLKDPFVELAKGSLNTFLNAMTYPDKTLYPIASENDKDFANLMDVYMDAVLNPNIYTNEKIFRQEGWHYEMEDAEGELSINGVVYNEMKGAFSSPDDVLERESLNSLFPDNTYAYESGGDPENIPDLSYEGFLDFHRRYYHPSNSYIYLYGDCNMEERLQYLDREYLSHYESIDPKSDITPQTAFSSPKDITKEYPIAEGDSVESNVYFQKNYVVGSILDAKLYQAFSALDYVLLNSPGAPLRKALMAEEIGMDVIGGYSNGTLQTYFSIGVKGANEKDKARFEEIVDSVLKEQISQGLDKQSLLAAINIAEFSYREADFGPYPKGLVYGMVCMDSWLYDDDGPFTHLHTIEVLNELKAEVDTGYFEKLIEKYLIGNNHVSMVTLLPKEGLASEREEKLWNSLSEKKNTMSKSQCEDVVEAQKALIDYQQSPTTPEEIATLPTLTRADLDRDIRPIYNRLKTVDGTDYLYHDIQSNGIHYLSMLFDMGDIPKEDLGDLSLMIRMLGLLDTKEHSYTDFSNICNIKTGGIYATTTIYPKNKGNEPLAFYCNVGVKFLGEYTEDAIALVREMICDTLFEDEQRIHEILNQEIAHFKMRLMSSGHIIASSRAQSRFSKEYYLQQLLGGIDFYEYLKDFEADFDKRIDGFKKKCISLSKRVFRKSGLFVSSTGEEKLTMKIEPFMSGLKAALSDEPIGEKKDYGLLQNGNEAFKTASAVQYVARAGDFGKGGLKFKSTLRILKTILSYDYFWNNIRVSGGAYGCMANFKRGGETYFVSYRDPNLERTDEIFENTPEYVASLDVNENDLTRYIIGTISGMDTPLTPSANGDRSLSCYIEGLESEQLLSERAQILDATPEDIRALSEYIKTVMSDQVLCVLGSESAIEGAKGMFESVRTLA